jgi:hypothetical protein
VVLIKDALYPDTMTSLTQFARKQFTGAETFAKNDFASMGLSTYDMLYEQFILGARGMAR